MTKNIFLFCVVLGLATSCASTKKNTPTPSPATTEVKKEVVAVKPPPTTASAKITMVDAYTCSRESDVREIYIEPMSPQGCKLWYSNRKGEPTASSIRGLSHCELVNQNVRKNLETAGFKCQAVSNTATTK